MPETILLPVRPDHAAAARAALELAGRLAARGRAEVHLLNVIDRPDPVISGLRQEQDRRMDLDALARRHLPADCAWRAIASIHAPVARYVAVYARRRGIGRILLPAGGRGRAELGDVARAILASAPCPVLTIAPPAGNGRGQGAAAGTPCAGHLYEPAPTGAG